MGKTKGFIEPKALRLNVHTFNHRHRKARACSLKNKVFIKTKSLSVQQTEGLKVGCGGKNKVFIKPLALGWAEGWAEGEGFKVWADGWVL